jgi:hypothetical protein
MERVEGAWWRRTRKADDMEMCGTYNCSSAIAVTGGWARSPGAETRALIRGVGIAINLTDGAVSGTPHCHFASYFWIPAVGSSQARISTPCPCSKERQVN